MSSEAEIREGFADQAMWCAKLGSPFTAQLLAGLERSLDRQTQTGRTILDWPGQSDAHGDAVALRLAGALHTLVRRGRLADLAALYPPHELPSATTLNAAVSAALFEADADICAGLQFPPQTNEVARSAVLYPGLMQIAAEADLPLALYEIGASAGLNLIPDMYAYRLGDRSLGTGESAVNLSPQWSGAISGALEPTIISRRGCDRNPIDVSDPGQLERLIGYVWPDQPERLSRLEAACALVANQAPKIDKADGADWVDEMFGAVAEPGVVRVLYHSIAFHYFPTDSQQRIATAMQAAGERATPEAPLAWLAFELYQNEGPRLTLRLWPDGVMRVLAVADAHVREVRWLS